METHNHVPHLNHNTSYSHKEEKHQTRTDLAAALQLAAEMDLHEGIDNHFSALVPGTDNRFLINPWGYHWSEVRASDLVEVDENGEPVDGKAPPEPTAFYIHYWIHHLVPDAKVVLHTHMPYATAISMIEDGRVEPALQTSLKFFNDIAYLDDYNGLALDDSEGKRIASALQNGSRIAFLGNHGVIVTGRSVAEAFDDLYYLERACKTQVLAQSTGKPLRLVPLDIADYSHTQMRQESELLQASRHFEALKRLLKRKESKFQD
jgi:ribulose-5-phosphate 4-epimerase/fuculose-1-phosphate aldolase